MGEEQMIKLLGEIRDLQKLHVENYKDAIRNQQESMELQRRAVRRQKTILPVLVFLIVVLLAFIASSHPTN